MSKIGENITSFLSRDEPCFGGYLDGRILLTIFLVFLLLCTDTIDGLFSDEGTLVWIILIALLLFKFDDNCC
ncbi:MAG: hypothetical protein LBN09_02190 [Clostridioides sp.]|jgi:hypothetical protein|nr:hypothetical protein [Clostridioides sp.]